MMHYSTDTQSNDGLPALKVYSELQQERLLPIRVQLTINHSDIDTVRSSTATPAAAAAATSGTHTDSSGGGSSSSSSDAQLLHALLSSVREQSGSCKADVFLTCDRVKVFA